MVESITFPRTTASTLRAGWQQLRAWLAPAECIGCGAPPVALCARCAATVTPLASPAHRALCPTPIWAALEYDGVTARLIRDLKAHGTRLAARALAPAIRELAQVDEAVFRADVIVVPPSRDEAWRQRGFHPIELVADAAGLAVAHPFEVAAGVRDQRRLGVSDRWHNLDHAFELRPAWQHRLEGKSVILLDDVVTTGATLAELTRACSAAGAIVLSAWALASTPRRDAVVDR